MMLPVGDSRSPLGEFTSSNLNRIGLITSLNSLSSQTPSKTILPPIKSLMTQAKIDVPSISVTSQELEPNSGITATTNQKEWQPRDHVQESSVTDTQQQQQQQRHKSSTLNGKKLEELSDEDFLEISKRLKVRLQLAYYKYKTQQTNKLFSDIKLKVSDPKEVGIGLLPANRKLGVKSIRKRSRAKPSLTKRKLLVSHGNYMTSAPRSPSEQRKLHMQLQQQETGIQSPPLTHQRHHHHHHQRLDDYKSIDSNVSVEADLTLKTSSTTQRMHDSTIMSQLGDHFYNTMDTTVSNGAPTTLNIKSIIHGDTTPVRPTKSHAPSQKQETPMSVKAAKSLMHLFAGAAKS